MADFSPTDPISVRGHAMPVVMSESTKLIGVAIFAAVADHFMKSETALVAVLAASGAVVTAFYGLWRRLQTWGALKFLATQVGDDVAVVRR